MCSVSQTLSLGLLVMIWRFASCEWIAQQTSWVQHLPLTDLPAHKVGSATSDEWLSSCQWPFLYLKASINMTRDYDSSNQLVALPLAETWCSLASSRSFWAICSLLLLWCPALEVLALHSWALVLPLLVIPSGCKTSSTRELLHLIRLLDLIKFSVMLKTLVQKVTV